MFDQVIGDGANYFIIVVAVLIAFGAGMSYMDYQKTKKEEEGK